MKIHLISSTDFLFKGTGVHSAFVEMMNLLKQNPYIEVLKNNEGSGDLCHSHSYGLYYFFKTLPYKGRRIHTVHTTPATLKGSIIFPKLIMPFAKAYFKLVYNHADVCIAISPMVKQHLLELGVKSQIVTLVNPINLDRWKFSKSKRKAGRLLLEESEDKKIVLGVGQLQFRKGIEDFIETAKSLPDVNFYWVGSRPFGLFTSNVRKMNQLITAAPANVHFIQQIAFEEMPNLYAAADAFLFPSFQENCPLAPLEAAATGIPVIFRKLKEYELLYNAPYLKAKNPADFAEQLNSVLTSKESYLKAQIISADLADQFDSSKIKNDLIDVYKQVLAVNALDNQFAAQL